ncbi:hypothetical protein ALC53_09827 [Atta colombica]|uniref:15-hydroxyprostaglandin dehydrogenase [NAD+] n=1 Tax=Atta colombica TaxID=520822 RepID=A0A195B630_9HYME|nr:hypothetical protein ALC53_09827 [Atta colombica]
MITGAVAGLGYKYAEMLLRNGVKSIAVVDLPTSNGQNAIAFIACDVTKANDFEKIFKKIIDTFKELDILIGIFNKFIMLDLIQKGKNGAAWILKDNESPCIMDFPPYFERFLSI